VRIVWSRDPCTNKLLPFTAAITIHAGRAWLLASGRRSPLPSGVCRNLGHNTGRFWMS
jgi:hypothetical protein